MEISEKIKHLRLSLGLDQREFATLLEVTIATISNWEHKRRVPRLPKIRKMIEIAKKNKIKINIIDFLS